mgnify:FL=1
MHTTITLPTTCSAQRDEEALVPEGLYGPPRWLDDRGVSALLAPYLCDGWDLGDYARFAELAGTDARRLASLLPKNARNDRQNNAPRIIELLRAASRIDGLTLEGYVIRAPRRDERVSIDTVLVPESAIIAHTGAPIDEERYPSYQHWLTLAEVLGLGDDAIPPDEMRVLIRDGSSTRWWWAWWD